MIDLTIPGLVLSAISSLDPALKGIKWVKNKFHPETFEELYYKSFIKGLKDYCIELNDNSVENDINGKLNSYFKKEIQATYKMAIDLSKKNNFDQAYKVLEKIVPRVVEKYEEYIELDNEEIKADLENVKKQIKKEEIASVNENEVGYYPWYLSISTLRLAPYFVNYNSDGGPAMSLYLGLESGIQLFFDGFYPFLSTRFSIIDGDNYYEDDAGFAVGSFQMAIGIGARYFTNPRRYTFNFGGSFEVRLGASIPTVSLILDGGIKFNVPAGFYYNAFMDIKFFPFNIALGIDGGFNFFFGKETPKEDIEFDTTLYPIKFGVSLRGSFTNFFGNSLFYGSDDGVPFRQGLLIEPELGFQVAKDLYITTSIAYVIAASYNSGVEGQDFQAGIGGEVQDFYFTAGIEWMINPSNVMFSIFTHPRFEIITGDPFTIFAFTINPGFAVQFLFPFGAYFSFSLPIILYPFVDLGLDFGFGFRWHF